MRLTKIAAAASCIALLATACGDDDDGNAAGGDEATSSQASSCRESDASGGDAADVIGIAEQAVEENDLQAVVLRVTRGGGEVVTAALGESMTGVPATPAMHFRNGSVAFSYLGTALLLLAEDGVVELDDTIDAWLPDVPSADQVTLRMLASSTSGYVDYVPQDEFLDALAADPFRQWTFDDLGAYVFPEPLWYEPGSNWSYSHMNFQLLGRAIEEITGQPLAAVLQERILEPADLTQTSSFDTPEIPEPVLHAFSAERGTYEESTFWNASWGTPPGAGMVTDVCDLATSAAAIGSGELLSDDSYETFLDPGTVGLGGPTDTCPEGVCRAQSEERHYGLGTFVGGDLIFQNPSFSGYAAVQAYLPDEDLAIAVANTVGPDADSATNYSMPIVAQIAATLAPDANLPSG